MNRAEIIIFPPLQKMQTPGRKRNNRVPNFRAMLDYFMAILMFIFGGFIIFSEKILGYDYFEGSWLVTGVMKWAIGLMFAFYGAFRAYRGYLLSKKGTDE